jgi:Zn-dependent peptidase ImmA (M78 family)
MASDCNERVRKSRKLLENPYAYLDGDGGYDGTIPIVDGIVSARPSNDPNRPSRIEIGSLLGGRRKGARFSRAEIEAVVRQLHREMWLRRNEFWSNRETRPLDILDPIAAFHCIGYSVEGEESLGTHSANGETFEVAGMVDNAGERAYVSTKLTSSVRNFTLAHELGHAVLHAGTLMHRDRPLDGLSGLRARAAIEVEADIFAAYFLLPERLVCGAFERRFLTRWFELNEATALSLNSKNPDLLRSRCSTLRDVTRVLAAADRYNWENFHSLADHFRVSVETVAIRLEELRLVSLPN